MNPLNNTNQQRPMNIMQLYSKVMQNPRAFLNQIGIPENINTPQEAVQFLLQSGKVSQSQINQAQLMAQRNNIKI